LAICPTLRRRQDSNLCGIV